MGKIAALSSKKKTLLLFYIKKLNIFFTNVIHLITYFIFDVLKYKKKKKKSIHWIFNKVTWNVFHSIFSKKFDEYT